MFDPFSVLFGWFVELAGLWPTQIPLICLIFCLSFWEVYLLFENVPSFFGDGTKKTTVDSVPLANTLETMT